MTDVRLFHTEDGGDVEYDGDTYVQLVTDSGLETAVYLSLWGGNERDPGTADDDDEPDHPHKYQWWGNHGESGAFRQTSETQNLIRSLPAVSSNLLRIEDAAKRDLQWFLDTKVASTVEVAVSLAGVKRIGIAVRILIENQTFAFVFEEDWGS